MNFDMSNFKNYLQPPGMSYLDDKVGEQVVLACGTATCWPVEGYFATLYFHLLISLVKVGANFYLIYVARKMVTNSRVRHHQKEAWSNSQSQVQQIRTDFLN